ncbi:MAG: GH36-type glycosyl hydrolase domain-containing protein [Gemmatimonadaceae bacterium]
MPTTIAPGRKRSFLSRLWTRRNDGVSPPLVGPIRGELFGGDRLAEHARAIAREQRLAAGPARRALGAGPLLSRLAESRRILDESRHELAQASDRGVDISPAGEWLLDNWYVILEHIREIGASMPRGFYRELPKLAAGPLAGYPRVYELAIELIAHTEGRLELSTIDLFTREFQRASLLTVGELWAIPTMLRLGLVENIRRMALRVVSRTREVELADSWARRLREASEHDPQALANELAAFVNGHPPLTAPFVTRFLQQIRSYQTDFTPLVWLEQWMAEDGLSHEAAAAASNQRLAITQLTVANSITSLRAIARLDWQGFVESQSVVEQTLREDPAGVHAQMTFETRDHYRHIVERIAKRTRRPEAEVARAAIALAQERAHDDPRDGRRAHVGYFLVDDGRPELEDVTGYTPSVGERVHRFVLSHARPVYFGTILVLLLGLLGLLAAALPPAAAGAVLTVILVAAIPASEMAVNAVNQIVTWLLPPRILPKLDMREHEIPPDCRTAIVVPTLLPSVNAVSEALEHLEIQYLANRERRLHFALLTDFTDAASETLSGDDAIVRAAVDGITALNARYAGGATDVFYLFHRPRLWNERQKVWMGWERKRGKLAQFNAFLRGGAEGAFSTIVGNAETIRAARFVITLDSDTVLPHDAAQILIGALAHPLNRPVFDEYRRVVARGYAILQPRVGVSLTSAHRSRFAAIHSGHPGVDPYTTAVSDVYQDLFGEGSYTGKGIYDVDAFEHATRGRFSENALLSHDLIESGYARAALVTDIEVFDEYPTRYLTYTRRKHRWTRGDWQLLPWLAPRVPIPDGAEPNVLGMVQRWKILDNLRRSTLEIAQLALLVLGWFVLPGSPWFWTAIGLTAIAFPWAFTFLLAVIRPPRATSWRAYYTAVMRDTVTSLQQLAIALVSLLHQAAVSADAIGRTLWRLFVSRRNLLEWQTASQTERITPGSSVSVRRRMAPAMAIALVIAVMVVAVALRGMPPYVPPWDDVAEGRGAEWALFLLATMPFVLAWVGAPHLAHALSAPAVRREFRLSPEERAQSMRYALLHWRYFETFVTPATHGLAPDNFQEDPEPVIAVRTSPTNIGLQLLAIVSAYDLGFVTREEMIERLEHVFRALERMRRFRGHLYNWYELSDLRVLEPAYVSTVDSGNLAGCFLALRQACLQIPHEPLHDTRIQHALEAALVLAEEATRAPLSAGRVGDPVAWRAVTDATKWARALRATLVKDAEPANRIELIRRVARESRGTADALRRASAARDVLAQAVFWLEWATALAERHLGELTPLAKAEPTATLRSLAAESPRISEQIGRLGVIAGRAHDYAMEMDFRFLFDERRKLFSIGYDVARGGLDNSFYDLLASEARLASFLAIAKDDVPVEHWFRLGRPLTQRSGATALVSWSGSMFEYLMPLLVMRSYPFTLLDQTYHGAVRRHVAYTQEWSVPWGISESAYNLRDRVGTYQYRAFGVPDLALKRGLAKDLVVAPYASLLAMHVDPHGALRNASALEQLGALGGYGFRDAIDWTRPNGDRFAIVRAFMAHHLGMGLASLANALTQAIWQRRFHSDPMVRAAELLLFERIPRRFVWQEAQQPQLEGVRVQGEVERPAVREFDSVDTPQPRIALLGNTPYAIMITAAGCGYSRAGGLAVTRWRNDATRDPYGQFCYVHDLASGRQWSVAHQPFGAGADNYRAVFALDRVMFHRQDGDFETTTEIAVVPDDAAEVRRIIVTNRSSEAREIELTSYAEVVIGSVEGDRSHPAFANLFVETEWLPAHSAILASRRPRSATEKTLWGAHVLAVESELRASVSCETDRARFLGRGLNTRAPVALETPGPLSNTTGAVLDPIFALRVRVTIPSGGSARVAFTTLMADNRERVIEMMDRYDEPYSAQRALDLSWTRTQVELRDLGMSLADASLYQELAGHLLHGHPALRPSPLAVPARPSLPALWGQGISGDWPILLATVDGPEGLPTVRQLVDAHYFLRLKGMTFDLVFVNMRSASYLQELNDQITTTVMASAEAGVVDRSGGIHIRRRELVADEDWSVLRAVARVHVRCDGTRLDSLLDLPDAKVTPSTTVPVVTRTRSGKQPRSSTRAESRVDHGFDERGNYRMTLTGIGLPPAPWANVVANERAGFCITEAGGGYAWVDNSQYFRLTPWSNDPVSDPAAEALYLRDEESGEVWTPTPTPIRHETPYVVTHGAGFTSFAHEHASIESVLEVGVAERDSVKISRLRLTNRGRKRRRLSLTYYAEWTLGIQREHTQHQVVTGYDRAHSAILARNTTDPQFATMVAFAALSEPVRTWTADRREFLGRHGDANDPAALRTGELFNEMAGAAIDPCAALQCTIDLKPGETRDIVALLGAERGDDAVRALLTRYRAAAFATDELERQIASWDRRLSAVVVKTPEPSLDVLVNRWLLYQALSCRMWGRSAVYQSSGAYGFRDQLQDVMAFVYSEPSIAREHILRAASRQFVEGDVQHWWHPPEGRGIRTRFSDDLAWLALVVDHYVRVTGDATVLDEEVPFLEMRLLEPHEHEVFDLPRVSDERATVYEHCLRALRRAATSGEHGLPLIGVGDWNDGMNRVGIEGRGESVWMAWFLAAIMRSFAPHAKARGHSEVARWLDSTAAEYAAVVEESSWDGAWYRRAYFDDGTPLGSHSSDECKIDSIAQTWGVISRAADPERARIAMGALEQHLVDNEQGIIKLLTPPFDETPNDPGYIKGYLPGVRENGAQYTHAALWVVLATAMMGNDDRSLPLWQMINPLSHTRDADGVLEYKVEPYVVAADVYTAEGHVGRGGWTWYTGSASWMYRVALEAILGFRKEGDTLRIEPSVPREWPGFSITYRHGASTYAIEVRVSRAEKRRATRVTIDGVRIKGDAIPLVDDGQAHAVLLEVTRT